MGETSFKIMLIIFNLIFVAFIGGIIIFIREYRIKKKAHTKQLETTDLLHKKELLKTQIEIQKQTMKHIGQEIHDNVGQKLVLSSLYLQQLPLENQTPESAKSIKDISNIINESLEDLRNLSKSLTDDSIEMYSIVELIEKECDKLRTLKKYAITFENSVKSTVILYEVKSVLLRITQEFIQNSIKHADCKNIAVSLHENEGKLRLVLKDDGKGFDMNATNSEGIGLKNIEKRVKIINGTFMFKSNPQNGTAFTLEIPL